MTIDMGRVMNGMAHVLVYGPSSGSMMWTNTVRALMAIIGTRHA